MDARSLIFITLLLPTSLLASAVPAIDKNGKPNVQSASALVIDLKNNNILYEKAADEVRPLASISKLVGALVIHEECGLKPDDLHEMSVGNREAAKGGDKTKLTTGWQYSHRDLMHAALMRSDNRALPALGEACGLDPAKLAERMTERVRRLGLTKTFFREPNGLSPENISTAREIMIFLREVIKVEDLSRIMTTKEYVITAHKKGRSRTIRIRSTDRLLSKNIATILGGKTGYTDLARYCFAVAAKTTAGQELGMVFLGAEGRYTRFADFTRVVKWLAPMDTSIAEDKASSQRPRLDAIEPTSKVQRAQPNGVIKAAGFGDVPNPVPSPESGADSGLKW